ESVPFSLASIGIKGTLTYKLSAYTETTPNDDRLVHNEGILQVEWARRLAPWLEAKLVGVAQGDDAGFVEGLTFQIPEAHPRRSILDLKEAVARSSHGPFEVSVGKQFFAWGTAEGFSPVDNLNASDYLDPLDREKIGAWSVAARATFGPANASF